MTQGQFYLVSWTVLVLCYEHTRKLLFHNIFISVTNTSPASPTQYKAYIRCYSFIWAVVVNDKVLGYINLDNPFN